MGKVILWSVEAIYRSQHSKLQYLLRSRESSDFGLTVLSPRILTKAPNLEHDLLFNLDNGDDGVALFSVLLDLL